MKRFRRAENAIIWAVVLIGTLSVFVRPYRVSEISMNKTLTEGDLVWMENLTAGIHVPSYFFYIDRHLWAREEGIRRGDILAFRHPSERRLYLKRCVALPGDRIFQRRKHFYLQIASDDDATLRYAEKYGLPTVSVGGKRWLKDPYRHLYPVVHDPGVVGPGELIDYPETVIPEHRFFMMGDYRDDSTDSRFFGPVPYDRIYYRLWWSWKKRRSLEEMGSLLSR